MTKERILSLDALRGLAVLLMVVWHFLLWLCGDRAKVLILIGKMPFGYLAGPLFFFSTGMGTWLSVRGRKERGEPWRLTLLHFVKRALALVCGGVALNCFLWGPKSAWIWDVLESIGVSNLVIALLFLRLSLPASALGVLVAFFVVLPWAEVGLPKCFPLPFRKALLEGVFPLFPWLGFVLTGAICGRWLTSGWRGRIFWLGASLLLLGLMLNQAWPMEFSPRCPSYAPFSLGASLLLFWVLLLAERRRLLGPSLPFIHLGRAALGVYVWHYLVGLNLLRLSGVMGKVPLSFGLPFSLLAAFPFWFGASLWLKFKRRLQLITGL